MPNKTADLNVRIEPEVRKQLQVEAHVQGMSVSKMVLNSVFLTLVENNIAAAKIYEEMAEAKPDGDEKARLKKLCNNSIRRAHYWKAKYRAVDELELVYKDIEAVTAYRDLLLEEVNA